MDYALSIPESHLGATLWEEVEEVGGKLLGIWVQETL